MLSKWLGGEGHSPACWGSASQGKGWVEIKIPELSDN